MAAPARLAPHGVRARELWALCGLLGLLVWLALGTESQARRHPYYVLRTDVASEVRPHILFVLDTSGSMSFQVQSTEAQCPWSQCEVEGSPGESRISVARRVIRDVVEATQNQASFALMTFEQYRSPSTVPPTCGGRRFTWVTWYGYFEWAEVDAYSSMQGTWRICQGTEQRPWPYLRWDDLGVGSVVTANHQTGAVPASPLISTAQGQIDNWRNGARKVQWFPKFMGVRVQLNATTDPDRAILDATIGDYGSNPGQRATAVWGHDFYYWPYVDGFPHYSGITTWPFNGVFNRAGVIGEDLATDSAALYAPFYLDLSETSVPSSAWGPATEEDALEELLWKTSPMIEGGLDVAGGTPWASVIGDIPAVPAASNAIHGHSTVASYLKFLTEIGGSDVCAPTSVVMVTDGVPSPGQGGAVLYARLADLRDQLGIRTYSVGFFTGGESEINEMACAAAGACDGGLCSSPCDDTPARDWDTCRDPDAPGTSCAYLADSAASLATVLTTIVQAELAVQMSSGPSFTGNDYTSDDLSIKQTTIEATTSYPGWKGHLVRSYCRHTDDEGALLEICQPASPEFSSEELQETFGPCPQSRAWDAGECLRLTDWRDRRIYSTGADGSIYRIAEANGAASAAFKAELLAMGLVDSGDAQDQANHIAGFILGKNWPDDWKLPGLAASAPVVVRRIPTYESDFVPSVNIRDPHCGGRRYQTGDQVPDSLGLFATQAWSTEDGVLATPSIHYEYQEAVLVGDDLGVLHAFQYDSGNELWGLLPRELLGTAVEQSQIGALTRGQPDDVADHIYGLASTVNQAWVYDDRATDPDEHRWRHVAVFGMGPGGREYFALDVSHMSPESPRGPFELLWSTQTHPDAAIYDRWLGETWARPAITYHVPADQMGHEPDAFLVMGSGYSTGAADEGRALMTVDVLTGDITRRAYVSRPTAGTLFDDPSAYGAVVDPTVASHCLSSFWAEAQEVYIADPAGRLFRWDLGRTSGHEADSGGTWADGGTAVPAFTLPACMGAGDTCVVSGGNPGEPFTFAPAVSANDRIDDPSGEQPTVADEFLVALVSGAADDDTLSNGGSGEQFHSSLYLLVDDHKAAGDKDAGFDIPSGAPKMTVGSIGSEPHYMRIAISDLARTRTFVPYEGATPVVDTRNFSPETRPVRAPRIRVLGAVDSTTGEIVEGNEVYEISFAMYEPPQATCDARFFDESTRTWYADKGDTFEIVLRLTASTAGGFDFTAGSSDSSVDFGEGFGRGLTLQRVSQLVPPGCEGGNCGTQAQLAPSLGCNDAEPPTAEDREINTVVPMSTKEISGFHPYD